MSRRPAQAKPANPQPQQKCDSLLLACMVQSPREGGLTSAGCGPVTKTRFAIGLREDCCQRNVARLRPARAG